MRSRGVEGGWSLIPPFMVDSHSSIQIFCEQLQEMQTAGAKFHLLVIFQCKPMLCLIWNASQRNRFLLSDCSQQHQMEVGKKKISVSWMNALIFLMNNPSLCFLPQRCVFYILEFSFCFHINSYCPDDFPKADKRHSMGVVRSGVMLYFCNC